MNSQQSFVFTFSAKLLQHAKVLGLSRCRTADV